jgi:hypothetical protein
MKPETQELLDRLSPSDRINLLDGLTQKYQRETAMLAGPVADMLAAQLRTLGLTQEAEYVKNLRDRIYLSF